jgi:hypothetical protein
MSLRYMIIRIYVIGVQICFIFKYLCRLNLLMDDILGNQIILVLQFFFDDIVCMMNQSSFHNVWIYNIL